MFALGCYDKSGTYISEEAFSEDEFARDGRDIRQLQGREVRIWGLVDHGSENVVSACDANST
jgi:hypothetical protein